MPINGLTQRSDRTQKSVYYAGVLHKGTRKINGQFGKDLNELFRFEPFSDLARKALLAAYPTAQLDKNEDVLLPYLDVFAVSGEVDKTFETWMKGWDASSLKRVCDRKTIVSELAEYTDRYGQPRSRQEPCNKPCPMANDPVGVECELGCTQQGELKFYLYLPQLLEQGIDLQMPVRMTLTGYSDLQGVYDSLLAIQEEYGSIKRSPFPCNTLGSVIPLVLRRTKVKIKRPVLDKASSYEVAGQKKMGRSAKKADGVTWSVLIEVNPLFRSAFNAWNNAQFVLGQGFKPTQALLSQTGVIDIDSVTPALLPAAIAKPSSEDIATQSDPIVRQFQDEEDWVESGIEYGLSQGLTRDVVEAIAAGSSNKKHFFARLKDALFSEAVDRGLSLNDAIALWESRDTNRSYLKQAEEEADAAETF